VRRAARGSGIAAFSSIFTDRPWFVGGKRRRASTVVSAICALPPSTAGYLGSKNETKNRPENIMFPKSALKHSLRSVFLRKLTFCTAFFFFDFHAPPFYGGLLAMISSFFVFGRVSASLLILAFPEMAQRGPTERSKQAQDAPRCPQDAARCPQEIPKMSHGAPEDPQEAPKSLPRAPQERPKRTQEESRGPKRPSRGPQEVSRRLQEHPKDAPSCPQDAPRCPQEVPKTLRAPLPSPHRRPEPN